MRKIRARAAGRVVWEDSVTDEDPMAACSACGAEAARSEMFGLEPELLCTRCASGVRHRTQIHYRPIARDRRPVVTLATVGLAVLLFVLDKWILPNPQLVAGRWPAWWEAVYLNLHVGPRVWDGQVWPLLGAAFFHAGMIHIFFNVWWVWELGRATESGFGSLALLGLVVGGAMVASGAEWVAGGAGVGLSGVLYALAFFLWAHHRTNAHAAAIMNRRTINFLSMWFVLCIILTMSGTWNIANWAHGGGALWGWGIGLATSHPKRRTLVPLAAVVTVLLVFGVTRVAIGRQAQLRAADRILVQRGTDERLRLANWFITDARLKSEGR